MRRLTINKEEQLDELKTFSDVAFAFDTETTSLRWMEQEVVGISLCDGSSTFYIDIAAFTETPRSECLELLRHIFSNPELVVGHNILFDLKALMRLGIAIPFNAKWYDTMTVEHLIDERSEKSLKKMAERYLDAKVVSYEEAAKSGIHSRKFAEYAKNDAQWTWEIFNIQIKRWDERVKDLYLHLEEPFLRPLLEMETAGILVDQKRVAKQLPKLKARTVDVECMVLDALGERYYIQMSLFSDVTTVASQFNMSSPQQLKNKLKSFGIEIPVVDGKESLDKAVLTSLVDKHPSIPLLLEHRKLRKLFSAFFDPLPQLTDSDGRIRPHFHNTGTRTGRLSCSEPNIQQLPKAVCAVCGHGKVTKDDECKKCGAYVIQVRKCFVAPEGKTLITCDYSGQEIRVLAHISQDPTMIDALLKGKDLHLTTANQFYSLGIPEEGLYTNDPTFEEYKEKFKQERDRAKCFHPRTEVLTRAGWKKIIDIDTNTEILQALPDTGGAILEWTKPTEVFTMKHRSKKIIELRNEGMSLGVTPDHRMLGFKRDGTYYDTVPQELNKARFWLNAGELVGGEREEETLLRLAVAAQADGSVTHAGALRFGFTKERKVQRLSELLKAADIDHSFNRQKTMWAFYIPRNEAIKFMRLLDEDKTFSWNLLGMSLALRKVIIEESQFWDSHKPPKWKHFVYTSVIEKNVDVLQAISSTCGLKARKVFNGKTFVLSIKDHSHTSGGNLNAHEVEYEESVACLSVPSTYVLIRSDGIPAITGQTINFGIAYGKGAYGFSQDFKISEEDAQGILDKYFQGFPKVKEAIEKCRRDVKKTGIATSMTGRQRHFEQNEQGYFPNSAFREAFNFLIQGFSADMIRMASVGTWKLAQEHPEWELKQIATVHDENVYEVKDEYLSEAKKEIRKVFEGVLPVFSVPMTAEVGSGDSYGTAK